MLSHAVKESPSVRSKFMNHHRSIITALQEERTNPKGPLYEYQVEAVLKTSAMLLNDESKWRDQHLQPEPVVVVAPTGSGKSGIITLIPYAVNSQKVLIITPTKVISHQLAKDFGINRETSFFEDMGLIAPGDKEGRKKLIEGLRIISEPNDIKEELPNVVIVNAQKFGGKSRITLSMDYRDEEIIPDVHKFFQLFDTLIIDEAHHYPADTWLQIVNSYQNSSNIFKKMVFVTATPYKVFNVKGQGRQELFILGEKLKDRIAYRVTKEMTEGKTIRPCEFREIDTAYTEERAYKEILLALNERQKMEPRVSRHQAMVLVFQKTAREEIVQFFNKYSNDASFAVEILPEAPQNLKAFTEGKYRVGVTCGVGTEGYNNANVSVCVILRKVSTRILFAQFIGRCMRIKHGLQGNEPDKTISLVLTFKKFKQKKMWETKDIMADKDPDDRELDEEDGKKQPAIQSSTIGKKPPARQHKQSGNNNVPSTSGNIPSASGYKTSTSRNMPSGSRSMQSTSMKKYTVDVHKPQASRNKRPQDANESSKITNPLKRMR